MAVKRKFHFPMSTLLYEGDLIITAAEGQTAFATKRLPANFVTDARAKLTSLGGMAAAKQQLGQSGDLTQQQNDGIVEMLDLFGKAKETAKKAFAGQDVKLGEEFQVGINKPKDLGSILGRAKIVLASCQDAANATALQAKGWIASDTTDFQAAIKSVGDIDKQQLDSQNVAIAGTDDRNAAANDLYDALLTSQNAANIEWPEKDANNRATREAFRLASFPPSSGPSKGGTPPPPAAPPKP